MIRYDLHCHILPGMDDGARTVEDTIGILDLEREQGVVGVVFTPHYSCEERIGDFVERREEAAAQLPQGLEIEWKLGAEVRFSPKLLDLDWNQLAFDRTDYLLIELPTEHFPAYVSDVLYQLILGGVCPILAHVERCVYFRKRPDFLADLIATGVLGQVNAESLLDRHDRGFADSCLKHGLAQLIASDAHSQDHRPPKLLQAAGVLDEGCAAMVQENAQRVWENREVEIDMVSEPKKRFGRFR